eukprot:TRINITY_DN3309_c0_g1_i2.p1 TRINITY_DN3309_c0_g1~~TRINITY_DN3309_c0_g1_i2.p1  ORF type:complete len:709 (-),score=188.36 TRINITY_DN3309_c0_g1_i2:77-2203(-)
MLPSSIKKESKREEISAKSSQYTGGFPQEIFLAYNKINSLARDLNTQIDAPEIVLIGKAPRYPLIESLLGFPLFESDIKINRPIVYSVVNNVECESPHITFKRDPTMKDAENDVSVSIENVSSEIKKRNINSKTPIKIRFEYKYCWNLQIFDTVPLDNYRNASPEQLEENVYKVAKPAERILVFVEEANEWDKLETLELAKTLDPKLNRSYFVLTSFGSFLKKFNSSRELDRFFSANGIQNKTFFVTQVATEERESIGVGKKAEDALKDALAKNLNANYELLEQLQYNKSLEKQIGLSHSRLALLDLTWRRHQDAVPEVLKRLRAFSKNSKDHLEKVRSQLASMDASKLRTLASNYTTEFLQSIEKLIDGNLEGNPSVNGQTLYEEKQHEDSGEWVDYDNYPIKVDADQWNIQYWESKLYGGSQFERLLREFKAVAEHTVLPPVTIHDIATSAGPNRLTTSSNYAWTASDIAQKKLQAALLPLVDQLFRRAVYILKRLVDIVDKMIENKRKNALRRAGSTSVSSPSTRNNAMNRSKDPTSINIEDYPYFTHSVKEMYFKFVDQTANTCKKKCLDEFYCTRLLFWELQQSGADLPDYVNVNHKDDNATRAAVGALSSRLFEEVRNRITKNVLLKCYNYFLIPMTTELWGEVQTKITTLSDDMLLESFEVTVTRVKLREDEKHLQQIMGKFQEQEEVFLEAANSFAHPNW